MWTHSSRVPKLLPLFHIRPASNRDPLFFNKPSQQLGSKSFTLDPPFCLWWLFLPTEHGPALLSKAQSADPEHCETSHWTKEPSLH